MFNRILSVLVLVSTALFANEPEPESEKSSKKKGNLAFFNAIHISSVGNVFIKQSSEPDFTIEADKKFLPLIHFYVKDNTLYIDQKTGDIPSDAKINFFVNVKDIKKIHSFSNAHIVFENTFEANALEFALLGGFGEANLNVNTKQLILIIKGAGKINVHGSATDQEMIIQGVGEIMGGKLRSHTGKVHIVGSGIATMDVSGNLTINIEGDGIVKYCDQPTIEKDIQGNGVVKAAEASECAR